MPQIISATEAREKFSELINRVLYRGEEFVVKKQGKPAALITNISTMTKKKKVAKTMKSTDFLLKLTTYNLKGGPKDLAKEHDKYTWE